MPGEICVKLTFLTSVFTVTAVYGHGDVVQHAGLSWPEGGGIMLGSYRGEPIPAP